MSPITLYVVLKYLLDIRPLTPLIFTKTSKNRLFLSDFFQPRPVSGQYRPDGWSEKFRIQFKTRSGHVRFQPYMICQVSSKFEGGDTKQTDRQTNKQTNKQTSLFYYYIDQGFARRFHPYGVLRSSLQSSQLSYMQDPSFRTGLCPANFVYRLNSRVRNSFPLLAKIATFAILLIFTVIFRGEAVEIAKFYLSLKRKRILRAIRIPNQIFPTPCSSLDIHR